MKKALSLLAIFLTACTSLPTDKQAQGQYWLERGISAYQKQDYQQALADFEKADQAGDVQAARYLGLIYLNGKVVPADYQRAAQLFKAPAEQGDATSQYWLGYLYQQGKGVKKDLATAKSWYERSAQGNNLINAPALTALGKLYEKGLGVKKDNKQAQNYYRQAAKLGDAEASALLRK